MGEIISRRGAKSLSLAGLECIGFLAESLRLLSKIASLYAASAALREKKENENDSFKLILVQYREQILYSFILSGIKLFLKKNRAGKIPARFITFQ